MAFYLNKPIKYSQFGCFIRHNFGKFNGKETMEICRAHPHTHGCPFLKTTSTILLWNSDRAEHRKKMDAKPSTIDNDGLSEKGVFVPIFTTSNLADLLTYSCGHNMHRPILAGVQKKTSINCKKYKHLLFMTRKKKWWTKSNFGQWCSYTIRNDWSHFEIDTKTYD